MTVTLSKTVYNIQTVPSPQNVQLMLEFSQFMGSSSTSERYHNNNLKTIVFSKHLGKSTTLTEVKSKGEITSFLDTKIKTPEEDPDKCWITTRNDYLGRIKYFFRWLHNCNEKELNDIQPLDWETPDFVRIKIKRTKRIGPYLESELWEKEYLLAVIKYDLTRETRQ